MKRKHIRIAGLNELMIVNPSEPLRLKPEQGSNMSTHPVYMDGSGILYRSARPVIRLKQKPIRTFPKRTLYLGEDGILYVNPFDLE
jgi:hypothetical protein